MTRRPRRALYIRFYTAWRGGLRGLGRWPQQEDEEQAGGQHPGDHPEAVDIGEHVRLATDDVADRLEGGGGRVLDAERTGGERRRGLVDGAVDGVRAGDEMEPDEMRVD